MARRWLLTILSGTALSLGVAGSASAQELGEPLTLDAEVVTVSVTADAGTPSLEAEVATDVAVEPADTDVSPVVSAGVAPTGPSLDVEGPATVGGQELPVPDAVAPVEEAVSEPAPAAPAPQDQVAAGSGVSAAPAPAAPAAGPAPVAARDTVRHSSTMTADRAAYRAGFRADATTMAFEEASAPAPEVAPPADALPMVAASAPTLAADLALPVIDTTPTVPAILRLLAGLLVVGAAATWRTVREELA